MTSYAITGFVGTKSCNSCLYLPVEVEVVEVIQNKQRAIHYTAEAGARSPQRALKPFPDTART